MSVADIAEIVRELVVYCTPAAFIINIVGWGSRVIIEAASGKGLRL